jgi:hypothetical protein
MPRWRKPRNVLPRCSSLTGSWSGAYRYPRDVMPETVFNAQIEEVGGAFTGTIQEPNLIRPDLGSVSTADLEGVRANLNVTFTKFYSANGGMGHAVRYEGVANAALTRIDGAWTIRNDWSGTFFMTRDDDGEEAEAEEAAEAVITHSA